MKHSLTNSTIKFLKIVTK